MNVFPLQWDLGPIEITGYGLMMMVAFLMGGWLIALQLRQAKLKEDYAADMVAAAVIGGIIATAVIGVVLIVVASATSIGVTESCKDACESPSGGGQTTTSSGLTEDGEWIT